MVKELERETFTTKIQTQGRILIPYHIRRELNLKEGDKVRITIEKVSPKREWEKTLERKVEEKKNE